ncbi:hypothetical protein MNB_SV-5-666 [hydrothermal vent metagenome]|uniref:Translocation and assembly module TamB C-terminal domain-containing protein n=1 Tax=hydrothermal vent metagenome TaxID=652676 RepID=A0A1W1EDA8_9ZZZZ
MIKALKYFLILFISLVVAIVVLANSSWLIKKVADKFAPDYKISYDDISGNVFTGVNISELKFDGKVLSPSVTFSWNPSKILYKRVAINEVSVSSLDVNVVKDLVTSFSTSSEDASTEDNETSTPLPVVILVDKVHLDLKPFDEQNIHFSKTALNVKDFSFSSDGIAIDKLLLNVDTNITKLTLAATLNDGKLTVDKLFVEDIDSVTAEHMFIPKDEKKAIKKGAEKTGEVVEKDDDNDPLNPFIPRVFEIKHFLTSILPREYKSANISELKVEANNIVANLEDILSNKENSISVDKLTALLDSNVSNFDLLANLKNNTLTIEDVNLKNIDTIALTEMFSDTNSSSVKENKDENRTEISEDKHKDESKKVNNLIPKYIVLKKLSSQIVPASYDPLDVSSFLLLVNDIKFNTHSNIVEKGFIDLNTTANLSNIRYEGKIKNNQLVGPIVISPNETLFKLYNLPLNKEAIGDIIIDIDASDKRIIANIDAKAKQILIVSADTNNSDTNSSDKNASKPFNLDIDSLNSHIVYNLEKSTLVATSKVKITTDYSKNISITNNFLMDENISYDGAIKTTKILGLDGKEVEPLRNFTITYKGNDKSIKSNISAKDLKGSFVSSDFKKGNFHLETIKKIEVGQLVELPEELKTTAVNLYVDLPINFKDMSTPKGIIKLTSNVANIDAKVIYAEETKVRVTTTIPKKSLLINFDKNVHYSAISPLVTDFRMNDKIIDVKIKAPKIKADLFVEPNKNRVDGKIVLAGMSTTFKAKPNGDAYFESDVGSFKSLFNSINQFYTVKGLPKIDGKLNLTSSYTKKGFEVKLASPKVIYHADRKTDHDIEDVNIGVLLKDDYVLIDSYKFTYNKLKIFSTKASKIIVDKSGNGNVNISEMWLNDQLKIAGDLATESRKGTITANAPTFHLAHEMIDMDSKIDIKTVLDGNNTDITGAITLLGGNIHYDLSTKSFPSDSDIIIVQEMKKEEESPIMENMTMAINVDTEKPLVFKQGPIDIQANVELGIHKSKKSEPMVLGEVTVLEGGSYTFEGKKFVIDKGHIYFSGNPSKPILDLSVKYKAQTHLITIGISGTTTAPNIIFSSVPSLTKEQILSVILFDSENGAGSNSGEDMMKMMGGAMAKSALANLGVKLDYLSIGADGSVEVGKKLTDKITFFYINDDVPQVKVKYMHSPRTESVITADEESQAYDIVYTKDYSEDDIVIFKK